MRFRCHRRGASKLQLQRSVDAKSHSTLECRVVKCRGVAQPGSAPALGAGGLRFKSGRPDQKYLACFLLLIESAVHLNTHLWNSGRQEVWSRKSFSLREFAIWRICKNMRRQECY